MCACACVRRCYVLMFCVLCGCHNKSQERNAFGNACQEGVYDIVQWMMDMGVDPNIRGTVSLRCVHMLCRGVVPCVVNCLLVVG